MVLAAEREVLRLEDSLLAQSLTTALSTAEAAVVVAVEALLLGRERVRVFLTMPTEGAVAAVALV